MAKLKTLLLHPDAVTRAELRKRLDSVPWIQILGEAVSAFEALELLESIPYGVFFLGVDLPGGVSGLELAQMLSGRKRKPGLVFIAASETKAYQAFEMGATDYLLWPATEPRFKKTLERLANFKSRYREVPAPEAWPEAETVEELDEETVQVNMGDEEQEYFLNALKDAWDQNRPRTPEIEKLAVTLDGRMILIPYGQIIFVEAYEDYSYVHTASQKFLTSYRLKNLEERLEPHRFFRVHRKYLVNLDMVTEIASLPGSNFMLRTAGKTRIELPIGRRRIARLKQILGF